MTKKSQVLPEDRDEFLLSTIDGAIERRTRKVLATLQLGSNIWSAEALQEIAKLLDQQEPGQA